MTITSETLTGGCLCGAVRYEAGGAPLAVGYCHCNSCRRHTGAPVVAYVGFLAEQVRFSGRDRSLYTSSPGVNRAFCGRCGTPLTWEGLSGASGSPIVEFHISTLDHPDRVAPCEHWLHGEGLSWFETADDLPRFLGKGFKGETPYRHGPVLERRPIVKSDPGK